MAVSKSKKPHGNKSFGGASLKKYKPSRPVKAVVAPSLPPAPVEGPLVPTPSSEAAPTPHQKAAGMTREEIQNWPKGTPKPQWWLPPDSKVRKVAMLIIAMRINGSSDEEIGQALKISPKTIGPYLYRANKNGWLDIDDPHDRVEYQLIPKAVKNLEKLLESGNEETLREVTMETLKGTLFKKFASAEVERPHQTMVAIRIEMPPGAPQTMREDTTGGVPSYIDITGDK